MKHTSLVARLLVASLTLVSIRAHSAETSFLTSNEACLQFARAADQARLTHDIAERFQALLLQAQARAERGELQTADVVDAAAYYEATLIVIEQTEPQHEPSAICARDTVAPIDEAHLESWVTDVLAQRQGAEPTRVADQLERIEDARSRRRLERTSVATAREDFDRGSLEQRELLIAENLYSNAQSAYHRALFDVLIDVARSDRPVDQLLQTYALAPLVNPKGR